MQNDCLERRVSKHLEPSTRAPPIQLFNFRDDFPPRIFGQLIDLIIERVVKSRNEEALFHIQMFKIFLLMDKGALRFDDVKTIKKCHFERALFKVSERRMSAAVPRYTGF